MTFCEQTVETMITASDLGMHCLLTVCIQYAPSADFFLNLTFFKKFFQEHYHSVKQFDQSRSYLQRLADDKSQC